MMYCVYSKLTGEIRAVFDTSTADAERQLQSQDEALYQGSADPRRHKILNGILVDLKDMDPLDGSSWDDNENRWISPLEKRRKRAKFARLKMIELEKRQPRIDREVRLRPSEVGTDGKTPLQRLEELDAEMAKLRAVINGETETIARED